MARFKIVAQARSSYSSKYTKYAHNVPSSITLAYEGMINENFYKLKKKETKLLNFTHSYFLVFLAKTLKIFLLLYMALLLMKYFIKKSIKDLIIYKLLSNFEISYDSIMNPITQR